MLFRVRGGVTWGKYFGGGRGGSYLSKQKVQKTVRTSEPEIIKS